LRPAIENLIIYYLDCKKLAINVFLKVEVLKMFKKISDKLEDIILFSEAIIAVILAVLIFLGIGYLAANSWQVFAIDKTINPKTIHAALDIALVVFITIEMFRIAIAYLHNEHVLVVVLEAAFLAVARKFVLYDFKDSNFLGAASLSLLLTSLALTYFVIKLKENPK
jgi:uncharacterized membrane protein (DUF373 family)